MPASLVVYLSMILLHIGVGVSPRSLRFSLLAAISVGLLTGGVIVCAERYLDRNFGDECRSCKSSVHRWIERPRLTTRPLGL